MHYYQFNIGDYRRDTSHLSHLEHGIYRALIDTYLLDQSALSGDISEIERKHSIRTSNEKKALRNVLNDFFKFENERFFNSRCDEVILSYQEKSLKASKSAKIRWDNDANALRTHSEGNANHKPLTNNHKPLTNNHSGRMARPTIDDVILDFEGRVLNSVNEAETFFNYYESVGWKVGKNPMKSWKHAITNWITRSKSNATGKSRYKTKSQLADDAAIEALRGL